MDGWTRTRSSRDPHPVEPYPRRNGADDRRLKRNSNPPVEYSKEKTTDQLGRFDLGDPQSDSVGSASGLVRRPNGGWAPPGPAASALLSQSSPTRSGSRAGP